MSNDFVSQNNSNIMFENCNKMTLQSQSPKSPVLSMSNIRPKTNTKELNTFNNNKDQQQFIFPFSTIPMMDTICEDNDDGTHSNIYNKYGYKLSVTPSITQSLSLSLSSTQNNDNLSSSTNPIINYGSNNTGYKSGDEIRENGDISLPTDDHPSLHPKYTNETESARSSLGMSSMYSTGTPSARSSANSYGIPVIYTKENLPKINGKNNNPSLSSKLIYDNMDKFQSQHQLNQNNSILNERFFIIEDEDEDEEEFTLDSITNNDNDNNNQPKQRPFHPFDYEDETDEEEEEFEEEAEYGSDFEHDSRYDLSDGELQIVNNLIPPSININLLTTESSTETQYECEYDEHGDHNLEIPTEFRTLSLSFNDGIYLFIYLIL